MKNPSSLLPFFFVFFLFSCSKKDTQVDPVDPPPVPSDTLTQGWTKSIVNSTKQLADVVFNNSDTGYLASNAGFYKSVNGGQTWDSLSPQSFINLAITPNGNLFAVLTPGSVMRSSDGGHSFVNTSPAITTATDIFFTGNDSGYAVGYAGDIFSTTDGGSSWQKQTTLPGAAGQTFASLFFFDGANGWTNSGNKIFRTNGSPASWSACNLQGGATPAIAYTFFATSSQVVFAGGENGQVLKSVDGGMNFSLVTTLPGDGGYLDMCFVNNLVGYASYAHKIYRTSDGGNTWQSVVSLGVQTLLEIHFTDASHGWACGNSGLFLRFKL